MKAVDETKLYEECAEKYKTLKFMFDEKTEIGFKETIYKMFTKMGGRVYCNVYERCIHYNGSIKDYTFGGYIMIDSLDSDFERLIEDLVRCYYVQNNGSSASNTYVLFDILRSDYL